MSSYIFIAYGPEAGDYVHQMVGYLGSAGLPVWPDHESASPHFTAAAAERIDGCPALVVVITHLSGLTGDRMPAMVGHAMARQKPIVALLLSGEPPAWLRALAFDDVRDGRMPGTATLDFLRRLAPAAQAPPPPRRTGRTVALTLTAVVAFALCAAGGLVGLNWLADQDPAQPAGRPTAGEPVRPGAPADQAGVGDCLAGTTTSELDAARLRVTTCSSPDAQFQVVGAVWGRRESEAEATCEAFAESEYVFWSGPEDQVGTVLCLKEVT